MFATDLVFSYRDLGLIISFNSEIITKRPPSKCFLLLESYFFFLALEAIVNCKTSFMGELSVTCNAHWERLKMVDNRNTVSFFNFFYIHKLSHKELLY